jgi:septal ring factor EnvC (AmiA/AmiB activator)
MLRDHPIPSLTLFLLGMLLANLIFWLFTRDNDQREIAALKERTGQVERKTIYSGYTNEQLKYEATRITEKLRTLRFAIQEEDSRRQRRFDSLRQSAQSDTDSNAIMSEEAQAIDEAINRRTDQFQQSYVGELRAVSAEIYHRIPETFS